MVNYYLTQNIDNLEEKAGFGEDDIVQAHGANRGATCAKCSKPQDVDTLKQKISAGEVMYCPLEECKGPVKPDITFFGENLPMKFIKAMIQVGGETDLLVVIGTSLAVSPFN